MGIVERWREWRESSLEDEAVEDEMRFHVEQETARNIRHGMDPARARREALKAFGGVDQYRERARDERSASRVLMSSIIQDLRFGLRLLVRERAFSLTVLLTLGVCIGANVAIYGVVDAVVLRPLPFAQPERLVTMYNLYPGLGVGREQAFNSAPDFFYRRARVQGLEEVAAYGGGGDVVGGAESIERVATLWVTPSLFPMLGVQPILGRTFLEEEMEAGREPTVLLTYGYWQERFGGAPDVVGHTMRLSGEEATIVGVLPRGFRMPDLADARLVRPIAFTPQQQTLASWVSNNFAMLGRLAPGATIEQVQGQIDALNSSMADEWSGNRQLLDDAGFRTEVVDARQDLVRNVRPVLFLLWASVAFVLLIGCVNIASLMLARAQVRVRELTTRLTLGASRTRVARQVLTEATLVGVVGAVFGVWLASGALSLLGNIGLADLPRGAEINVNATVLLYTVALALTASIVIGAIPAASLFRREFGNVFRAEGRGSTAGRRAVVLRGVLVAGQVAIAFLLLVGAGLMLRSFQAAQQVDPGFVPDGVLTASIGLPTSQYPDGDARRRITDAVLTEVRALPGVTAAAVTSTVPFGGRGGDSVIRPEDYEPAPGESLISPRFATTGPDYFETMGIPVLDGRTFEERDAVGATPVIVIDRTLARRYWPDRSPVGYRMVRGSQTFTIIGVVETIKHDDLTAAEGEHVGAYYFTYQQAPQPFFTLVARTALEPMLLAASLRNAIARLDPELPLFDVQTMESRIDASLGARRMPLVLLLAMAGIALFLALIGIYGVLSYSVTQRTREIGVRLALGGEPASILRLVLKQGLLFAGLGLAAGGVAALFLVQLLESLLFGVAPLDPFTWVATGAVLAVAALAACLIPARRATKVDPIAALVQS